MDEMMMGGVDVSAADGNRTFSGVHAPVVQRPPSPNNGNSHYDKNGHTNGTHSNGTHENGTHSNGQNNHNGQSNGHYRPTESNGGYPSPSATNHVHRDAPHTGEPRNFGTHNGAGRESERFRSDAHPNETHHSDPHGNKTQYGEPHRDDLNHTDLNHTTSRHLESPYSAPLRDEPYHSNGQEGASNFDTGRERGFSEQERHLDEGAGRYAPDSATNGARPAGPTMPGRSDTHYPANEEAPRPAPTMPPTSLNNGSVDNRLYESPTYDNGSPASTVSGANRPNLNEPPVQPGQVSNLKSTMDSAPATRPPLPPVEPPPRQATLPVRPMPQPVDEHTQWATGADKWEYQDFAANPQEQEDDLLFGGYATPSRPAQESAVRQDPALFVSAMSVMAVNKKRSTLLPRSSELDVDTLHREISDLHGEIAALLPVGNETSERARHLLDKAYSILQSDPTRSAEVEYYMQQVRTIVQRLHQARQWSDLYRQRLHVYLWAWLGLSAMLLIATFVFQEELELGLMWLGGLDASSWLVENWTTFIGTAAAGALGGAIGALYTMRTHARGEHSFFDRKYGLRGLILPFMGLIVGAVGYLIFGLLFGLVGINPSESLTAAIMPMVAAFAFGFSQESIYGTRN